MGLIGDHGEALALGSCQLLNLLQGEREGLDGADDDLLAVLQRLGELSALAALLGADGRHDAGRPLEVEDGFLQLGVQDIPIGHHQDAAEQLLVLVVMQVGQEVGRPGDGIGLAGAGGVLDQVSLTRPLGFHVFNQFPSGVQLVVAGKDDRADLALVVPLGDQIPLQDLEPALALPDLLPQVGRGIAAFDGLIARTAVIAPIEGKEPRLGARQAGGHLDLALADREVHQSSAREGQEGLAHASLRLGMPIKSVLVDGITHALGEVGLQLGRRHRDAIEEQHDVQGILGLVRGMADLADHPKAVGVVPGEGFGGQ